MIENLNGLIGFVSSMQTDVASMQTDIDTNLNGTLTSRAPAATALSTATWPSSLASNLASRITKTQTQQEDAIITRMGLDPEVLASGYAIQSVGANTWQTAVNITSGSGIVYAFISQVSSVSLRLTIDGVAVCSDALFAIGLLTPSGIYGAVLPGMNIVYKTSMKMEFKYTQASGGSCRWIYS